MNISEDSLVIGTVSRIEKAKGIEEMILAALSYLQKNPKTYFLIIGGPSAHNDEAEKYYEYLKGRVAQEFQGKERRIIFKGPIPASYKYLKALDLYVLPSYLECFSLSLLDAQLASLPLLPLEVGALQKLSKMGLRDGFASLRVQKIFLRLWKKQR